MWTRTTAPDLWLTAGRRRRATPTPAFPDFGARTWRCPIDENARPTASGWLYAHPDQLDQYAREIDDLVGRLRGVLRDVSEAARFRAPSVDPATSRASQRLAEDAHDRPGTPTRSIAAAIERLVHQAETARANARDYREIERRAIDRLRDTRRDTL